MILSLCLNKENAPQEVRRVESVSLEANRISNSSITNYLSKSSLLSTFRVLLTRIRAFLGLRGRKHKISCESVVRTSGLSYFLCGITTRIKVCPCSLKREGNYQYPLCVRYLAEDTTGIENPRCVLNKANNNKNGQTEKHQPIGLEQLIQ